MGKDPDTAPAFLVFLSACQCVCPAHPAPCGRKPSGLFNAKPWKDASAGAYLYAGFLALLALTAMQLLLYHRKDWNASLPWLASCIIPLLFLLAYTVYRNHHSSQNARYIYPALIGFVCLAAHQMALTHAPLQRLLRMGEVGLIGGFSLLSVKFFITQMQ